MIFQRVHYVRHKDSVFCDTLAYYLYYFAVTTRNYLVYIRMIFHKNLPPHTLTASSLTKTVLEILVSSHYHNISASTTQYPNKNTPTQRSIIYTWLSSCFHAARLLQSTPVTTRLTSLIGHPVAASVDLKRSNRYISSLSLTSSVTRATGLKQLTPSTDKFSMRFDSLY